MDWSRFIEDPWWEAFGIAAQMTFAARFIYQWLASERAKRSIVPTAFWWISLAGSFMIMTYAVHKASLPFMIPFFTGAPIYARNLFLIHREKKRLRM